MRNRIEIYQSGTVNLIRDLPGVQELKIVNEGPPDPLVETREVETEEFENLQHQGHGKVIHFDHKRGKFVFVPMAGVS